MRIRVFDFVWQVAHDEERTWTFQEQDDDGNLFDHSDSSAVLYVGTTAFASDDDPASIECVSVGIKIHPTAEQWQAFPPGTYPVQLFTTDARGTICQFSDEVEIVASLSEVTP